MDNPITYAEELPSFDDSLKAKLLIAAMLDRTFAHDAPEQDFSEAAGGVHTNYIQFMDKVVREWSGELKEHTGLEKLVQIHRKALEITSGSVYGIDEDDQSRMVEVGIRTRTNFD